MTEAMVVDERLVSQAQSDVDAFAAAAKQGVPLSLDVSQLSSFLRGACGLQDDLVARLKDDYPLLPRREEELRVIAIKKRVNLDTLTKATAIPADVLVDRYQRWRRPRVPGSGGHSGHGHGHPPHGNILGVIVIGLAVVVGMLGLWGGLRLIRMRVHFRESASIWFHLVGLWSACVTVALVLGIIAFRDTPWIPFAIAGSVAVPAWFTLGVVRVRKAYPAATIPSALFASLCGALTTFGILLLPILLSLLEGR